MSCTKTRGVLDQLEVGIAEERNSNRAPFSDQEVRGLLASVDEVIVARGKASRTLTARNTALDDLRGPTGGFRAPMVRRGRTLLVGFSEAALRALLGR